jgi:leucyl-tRNA synthetase
MQRHWIGRTPGAEIDFSLLPFGAGSSGSANANANGSSKITVFSTRAETTFGACALVLSTDHPLILGDIVGNVGSEASSTEGFLAADHRDEVISFCTAAAAARRAGGGSAMTTGNRDASEPRGVWTGRWATNPVTGQAVSVWVGDYVLMGFGTGTHSKLWLSFGQVLTLRLEW